MARPAVWQAVGMTENATHAWGFGLATVTAAGTVLDVWYPAPVLGSLPVGA